MPKDGSIESDVFVDIIRNYGSGRNQYSKNSEIVFQEFGMISQKQQPNFLHIPDRRTLSRKQQNYINSIGILETLVHRSLQQGEKMKQITRSNLSFWMI